MTAPYTQKCALWIPWTVMKGHETTFLHTARTPGSFFQWFHAPLIRYIEVRRGQIVTLFMRNRFEFHMTSRIVGKSWQTANWPIILKHFSGISGHVNEVRHESMSYSMPKSARLCSDLTSRRFVWPKFWNMLNWISGYDFKSLQLNQTKDPIHTKSDLDRF